MKIFVAHPGTIDFQHELYGPLRESSLSKEHEIFLPHEGKSQVTKELIKQSDLLIAEVSVPSTGSGVEMGWADAFNVPILALHKEGTKRSNSVSYVAKEILEYENSEDLIEKIENFIKRSSI